MAPAPTKLIIATFLTLDGVMQAPGGQDEDTEGGFANGGWQMPYFDETVGAAVAEGMAKSDAFLLGRKTCEIFAGFWPTATDDFAAVMNGMTKYVASRSLDTVEWENSTLLEGDVATAVAELKRQPGRDISVIGSGGLTPDAPW